MTTIAVLGTGIMGGPMARNLAAAGLSVRAWNRTREKAEAIGGGVRVCDSPREAMTGADAVLTMLADADAVERTVTQDDALAAVARDGDVVWVQCSTVGVDGCERLARIAGKAGVPFVDAPVLGTRKPAEDGALTVLAAGPQDLRDRVQPVFDAVGQRTVWLDTAGQGSRLKLVMNSWVVALTAATAEALALAGALGLDPTLFLSTLEGGSLDVPYAHLKGGLMLRDEFPTSFPAWGAAKDAGLILEAAESAGLRLQVAEAVRAEMQAAVDAGRGDDDMASVFTVVRRP